jgi:transcriptional repressor NrdR
MKCPFCKSPDTQVIDSRVSDDGESIRRRRKCTSCSKRFTTYETIELRMPQVVKQDGTRSEFDLAKLRTGFMRALHKRPVPTQLVDDAIATITQDVLALGEREVPSRRLGEMVMRELKRLDQVAYIRFASVYRSFQGVDDFQDAWRASTIFRTRSRKCSDPRRPPSPVRKPTLRTRRRAKRLRVLRVLPRLIFQPCSPKPTANT